MHVVVQSGMLAHMLIDETLRGGGDLCETGRGKPGAFDEAGRAGFVALPAVHALAPEECPAGGTGRRRGLLIPGPPGHYGFESRAGRTSVSRCLQQLPAIGSFRLL
jgi:hypothetical protein